MTIQLYHWKAYMLLSLLALWPNSSHAADPQCFADLIACASDSGGQECVSSLNVSSATAFSVLRTSNGLPIIDISTSGLDSATGLSYAACVEYCGADPGPFDLGTFTHQFGVWLLPYLALLSQLPFGAPRRTDNVMSVILTVGSPVLAGYSVCMTLLNARWVNDRLFSGVDYPNPTVRRSVVQVLTSLQQVPVRVYPGESARFESLVVHPDNDDWWTTLSAELDYSHTWSVASATSVIWVVIAYLLTVADALSNVLGQLEARGDGIGSVWLWSLPVVVGWLLLSPKCDHTRVHDAYDKANRRVFVVDSNDPNASPTMLNSNFGLTIRPGLDWKSCHGDITSPDELRIPPVFNYARVLSWSQTVYVTSLYYRAAWRKSNDRIGVDGEPIPCNVRDGVPRQSRIGNRDQTVRYCRPDGHEHLGLRILWPRGVLFNMIMASFISLQLQWGTTGAAILAVWFIPTVGLGCRSLAYTIYGALSTAVWLLLVLSSLLGYYAHHLIDNLSHPDLECDGKYTSPPGISEELDGVATCAPCSDANVGSRPDKALGTKSSRVNRIIYIRWVYARTLVQLADLLRWIGKSLAILNVVGVLANSILQYSGVYANCYCNSSIFTWGSSAFVTYIFSPSGVSLTYRAWVGALMLVLTSCAFFIGIIFLTRDSLPY